MVEGYQNYELYVIWKNMAGVLLIILSSLFSPHSTTSTLFACILGQPRVIELTSEVGEGKMRSDEGESDKEAHQSCCITES